MTFKAKRFGLRYICNNQSKLSNGSSTDKSKIFDTPLRKIPEKEREAIKSFLISKAENLLLSGKFSNMCIRNRIGLSLLYSSSKRHYIFNFRQWNTSNYLPGWFVRKTDTFKWKRIDNCLSIS